MATRGWGRQKSDPIGVRSEGGKIIMWRGQHVTRLGADAGALAVRPTAGLGGPSASSSASASAAARPLSACTAILGGAPYRPAGRFELGGQDCACRSRAECPELWAVRRLTADGVVPPSPRLACGKSLRRRLASGSSFRTELVADDMSAILMGYVTRLKRNKAIGTTVTTSGSSSSGGGSVRRQAACSARLTVDRIFNSDDSAGRRARRALDGRSRRRNRGLLNEIGGSSELASQFGEAARPALNRLLNGEQQPAERERLEP
ncbi:hypothetical protein HPB48_004640 [Haemaphysalis longicornis]|uniref:Uncharacterized protein n=1 Tax=Haemaphysalis longicornis TaxID=44386 RepID=A0A9J6G092_HAELO|nr:hypothetical protein HPB48_004640 [Haemaphysalis longicornis]